tara:strand:- start:42 stop:527 length:486 start_codon:yes stop_codon:yes gene_type:complete
MKKFYKFILIFSLIIGCAKPTVIDITKPEDQGLNCDQLTNEMHEALRYKREALSAKDVGTGGNMTRAILFWPALAKTFHNADVAITAANDRGYHLLDIMKQKNCNNSDQLYAELTNTTIYSNESESAKDISEQLKNLNELYKSGALTDDEYKEAKRKVLED